MTRFRWAPRFYLDAQAQFFQATLDGCNDTLTNARISGTWMFSRHVGLGYDHFGTDVEVDRRSFNGNPKLRYSGLQRFITERF
jgi:hypothetical protein